jgi:hypothetical protein
VLHHWAWVQLGAAVSNVARGGVAARVALLLGDCCRLPLRYMDPLSL